MPFARFRVVLLLLLAVSTASAQNAPWKGWIYQLPAGWTSTETPDTLVLHPGSGGPVNQVLLLAPEAVSGDLGSWFPSAVAQRAASLRGFRPGTAPRPGKTTGGVPTLTVTGQAVTPEGQRLILSFVGLLSQNGAGLLLEAQFDQLGVFRNLRSYGALVKAIEPGEAPVPSPSAVASASPSQPPADIGRSQPPADLGRSQPRGRNNANTAPQPNLELAPLSGPPPATPNGHDLYDWFGSFRNSLMPGPNFTLSSVMVWEFYRFFPSGYLYEGMPSGVDPALINCNGPGKFKGGSCKHYTLSGNTLTIDGEKPHTFALTADGIKIDGSDENRVRRASGTLSGTWKTSAGGGVGTTVTLSQHLLTLRPDGTFSLEGSTGVSGSNVAAYNSSANAGHYTLHDYTIDMLYSNGRSVHQSFLLPYPDNKVFLIGDSMYFTPSK